MPAKISTEGGDHPFDEGGDPANQNDERLPGETILVGDGDSTHSGDGVVLADGGPMGDGDTPGDSTPQGDGSGDGVAPGDLSPQGDGTGDGTAPGDPGPCANGRSTIDADLISGYGALFKISTQELVIAPAANRLLIVAVAHRGDAVTLDSVTFNQTIPMAKLNQTPTADDPELEVYYLVGPPAGAGEVEIAFDDTTRAAVAIVQLSGVDQLSWLDEVPTSDSGDSLTATVTVATHTKNTLVLDAMAVDDVATTPIFPQLGLWDISSGGEPRCYGGFQLPTSPGASVTVRWTLNPDEKWRIVAIPIRPACLP